MLETIIIILLVNITANQILSSDFCEIKTMILSNYGVFLIGSLVVGRIHYQEYFTVILAIFGTGVVIWFLLLAFLLDWEARKLGHKIAAKRAHGTEMEPRTPTEPF